jgi:hypothetical protein
MYKLSPKNLSGEQTSVIHLSDGACIPLDPANTDYQKYLEWTKASPKNVAEPADE